MSRGDVETALDGAEPATQPRPRRNRHGRSLQAIAIALGIFTSLLASVHYYFIARFVHDTGLTGSARTLATSLLVGLGLSVILNPLIERRFGPAAGRVLAWPAYIWMAACFYLLLGLGVSDLVLAITGAAGSDVMARRALIVLASVGAILSFGFASAMRTPRLKRVEHAIEGLAPALDGYSIAQLSDVHIGTLIGRGFAARVTARVNEANADAVAITGDLVDGEVSQIGERVQPFGEMKARDGVFFVTGNHDYYSGAQA